MTTPALREAARAICRVQYNGGDPDQPAVRWNGTEMEPQEFPAWEDFLDEARAVIAALAQPDEAERCPICSGHKGFFEGELWTPCVNCDGTGEKPCPDCAEMAKQRDHYREKSRANSSGQLAEELSCALARIERLERALEAGRVLEKALHACITNEEVEIKGTSLGADIVAHALNTFHKLADALRGK